MIQCSKSVIVIYSNWQKSKVSNLAIRGRQEGNNIGTTSQQTLLKNIGDDHHYIRWPTILQMKLKNRFCSRGNVSYWFQCLITLRLASLTQKREPIPSWLSDENLASVRTEMIRWRCKWQNVEDKPSTPIESLIHAKLELYFNIYIALKVFLNHASNFCNRREVLQCP